MGDLCRTFERTRAQLEQNHRELWRAIEERKRLNAAFAHDLRTPLTVLRGYVDFLGRYVPQGKITEEKLLSTLSTMSHHITRLEQYVATMNEAQRLDDISAKPGRFPALPWQTCCTRAFPFWARRRALPFRSALTCGTSPCG